MRLRVAIAADHGGFELKQELVRRLTGSLDIVDLGAETFDPHDDYPDYVERVGQAIGAGVVDRGIIICGSGVGACVAANKMASIRACVCHDTYSAHQGVEHDDLNTLCLGARVVGIEVATELAVAFLMARFSGDERHRRRLEKVEALERERLSRGRAQPAEASEPHPTDTALEGMADAESMEDNDEIEEEIEAFDETDEAQDAEEAEETDDDD